LVDGAPSALRVHVPCEVAVMVVYARVDHAHGDVGVAGVGVPGAGDIRCRECPLQAESAVAGVAEGMSLMVRLSV